MGKWADIVNKQLKADVHIHKKQLQVYLAGPMRGYEEFNFPAFLDAGKKLRAKGFKVHSPAEYELQLGFDPKTGKMPDGKEPDIRVNMRDDLSWICEYADMVVVMPGWQMSRGVAAEVKCADAIGIPVKTLESVLGEKLETGILDVKN